MSGKNTQVKVEHVDVSTFTIPTATEFEQDGTLSWESTTLVLVEVTGGGKTGIGYTYADKSVATLISGRLAAVAKGADAMNVPAVWWRMYEQIRNLGRPGIVSMAMSALDTALWDLKAKILDLPLVSLLGQIHPRMDVYGSGGFTNYSDEQLQSQLRTWVEEGISRVKIKVGANPNHDIERVGVARDAIGPMTELFVDANGAYDRKDALRYAEEFYRLGCTWFEEPVSSDDITGLRLLRDRAPGGMDIATGEYGYDVFYFRRLLENEAVDVLQVDATRAGGVTGFLQAAALCEAWNIPLSAHTAPALHTSLCCAVKAARHQEYFYDHARIEEMLFDGVAHPESGALAPSLDRPGFGFEFKKSDAARYAA